MSTRYIERAVEDMRDDPQHDNYVTLLLGVGDAPSAAVEEKISELGGETVERLPFDTLEVRIPETAVTSVCAIDGLESIETDESLEDLDSGNLNSPESSIR